ncbi:PTS sugar transporter subunit IIA [Falsibacillus pallidus]|uniref:PTS system IIA component (Glc family) n=1 Tax=Falsibacillus pallidus TaxID=493781 RepID=A0A370GL32_9BACI|nr:PTS glucose transporter subunit IIA [Falsibacillus pallidus]RDI43084.1 PTS system IIA component (Glc family) [Falsibacillus pallidus]
MLNKLFGIKGEADKNVDLFAPMSGKILPLEEVPDPVFSQRMMGDGFAIEPSEGVAVAPFDGTVIQLFPTKHAIGLKAENGAEVLIHIGLETVSMNGEGFEAMVSEGDKVKKGDSLVTFDIQLINEKASSVISPIIVTNGDDIEVLNMREVDHVKAGSDAVMDITVK